MSVPECESPTKEVVEGVGSGLVGLHLKGVLVSKVITISGTVGRAVPPESARPQVSASTHAETRRQMYYTDALIW